MRTGEGTVDTPLLDGHREAGGIATWRMGREVFASAWFQGQLKTGCGRPRRSGCMASATDTGPSEMAPPSGRCSNRSSHLESERTINFVPALPGLGTLTRSVKQDAKRCRPVEAGLSSLTCNRCQVKPNQRLLVLLAECVATHRKDRQPYP